MKEAKDILYAMREIDKSIESKLRLIAHYEEMATRVTTIIRGDVGGGGSAQTMEDYIARAMDLGKEAQEEMNRQISLKKEVQRAINHIEDDRYRIILEQRYIRGADWAEIQVILAYSRTQVYEYHKKAIKAFTQSWGKSEQNRTA